MQKNIQWSKCSQDEGNQTFGEYSENTTLLNPVLELKSTQKLSDEFIAWLTETSLLRHKAGQVILWFGNTNKFMRFSIFNGYAIENLGIFHIYLKLVLSFASNAHGQTTKLPNQTPLKQLQTQVLTFVSPRPLPSHKRTDRRTLEKNICCLDWKKTLVLKLGTFRNKYTTTYFSLFIVPRKRGATNSQGSLSQS